MRLHHILIGSLFSAVRGVYFYVPPGGSDKCFGEEAYPDAVIHVSYKHEQQQGLTCLISFFDHKGVVLFQKPLTDPKGKVATVVPKDSPGGQHKVCLEPFPYDIHGIPS